MLTQKFPLLQTKRLLLREINAHNLPLLLHLPDEQFKIFLKTNDEKILEKEKKRLNGFGSFSRISFVHWHIIHKESGEIIGDIAFHLWNVQHYKAEIGYIIKKESAKNKGYMSEALEAVLKYGFENIHLQRIEAYISPNNEPSLKLVKKFGFQKEGFLRHHYHNRMTQSIDASLLFALTIKDYQQLQPTPLSLASLVHFFEKRSLPIKFWTHEAHLSVATWYLTQCDKAAATCFLRSGIIAYNTAMGVKNTPENGYHETITLFWIWVIDQFIQRLGRKKTAKENVKALLESPYSNKNLPMEFYSRELLFSTKARAVWVKPDLKDLALTDD